MNILNFNKFFESALTIKELSKDAKGQLRGDILINKIKSEHQLQLEPTKAKGDKMVVKKMLDFTLTPPTYVDVIGATSSPIDQITNQFGKFDSTKANSYFLKGKNYLPIFKDDEEKVYKLNDLFKTTDFGSRGAGKTTNENEIIQMLLLAKRILVNRDFTMRTVNQHLEDFESGIIPPNVVIPNGFRIRNLEHFDSDPEWMATFRNSINNLAKAAPARKSLFDPTITYKFYQNSVADPNSIHKIVIKKFKDLLRSSVNDDMPNYFKDYIGLDFAKYCPADVWAVTANENDYNEICSSIKTATDILDLNRILNAEFEKRTLIPISLKKVGIKVNSGKIIVNNENGAELPKFNVTQFHIEPEIGKGIGSKIDTTSIWYPKGEVKPIERQRNIKIDTSNSSKFQNVDGEIDGVYSRHGKISFLMMKRFIEESPLYDKVLSIDETPLQTVELLKNKNVQELKDIIEDLNAEIKGFENPLGINVKDDLKGRPNDSLEKKLISKIQSLQIIRALSIIDYHDVVVNENPRRLINGQPNPDNEIDKIVTKVLLYALSIHTGGFSTPRYARVI